MGTYNGARYLREQLDSFVNQTRLPDELVICDDCSNDETVAIIRNFAEKAPFAVKWEQNEENLGFTGNFSKVLSLTNGDLVFLSDQDDVWFDNKIETMAKIADEDRENLLFMNDAALTDASLSEVGLTKMGQIRAAGFDTDIYFRNGCCAAIKRDLLDICLPVPKDFIYHDRWIEVFAMGLGRKRVIDRVLQYYRRHDANESRSASSQLKKANQLNLIVNYFKFQHSTNPSLDSLISQYTCILNKIKALKKGNTAKYFSELSSFENKIQSDIEIMHKRLAIRKYSRIYRFFPVWKMYLNGGYSIFWGFKSAMRDIIFR